MIVGDSVSFKIVLAHGAWQGMDRLADEREGFVHFVKGQMEGLLVAVEISIVKVVILIEP